MRGAVRFTATAGCARRFPAPQPGENPALTRLRALLAEVPEEIRRWDAALAQWNGCITPQQKWDYAQKNAAHPCRRSGRAKLALRRAQARAPKTETAWSRCAARWMEKSSNR